MTYSFTNEDELQSEGKITILHGYDNKRYFIPKNNTTLVQYAYRVNKLLALLHLIYEDIIFKTELAYTDVIYDKKMSDYTQLSFGLEKGFYDIKGMDSNLYIEYYRYIYADDKNS